MRRRRRQRTRRPRLEACRRAEESRGPNDAHEMAGAQTSRARGPYRADSRYGAEARAAGAACSRQRAALVRAAARPVWPRMPTGMQSLTSEKRGGRGRQAGWLAGRVWGP